MAKRGQPSYRPGELDRVRGRLGPLAEEEAKRMADLLGGEVGTEATDAALEASYQRLRRSSTAPPAVGRKGVGPARKPAARTAAKTGATAGATSARGARRSSTAAAAGAADGAPPVAIELGAASQLGYRDRVKIDFWAARHGYRLKSLGGAVASLLSFAGGRDYVSARFVREISSTMFGHIEKIATASAALTAATERVAATSDAISVLSRQIVSTFAEWDIRPIHQQLTSLQRTPRTVQFRQLDDLLRRIYRPLLLLGEVDDVAAAHALREYYEVAKEAAGERKAEVDRLTRRFLDARGSLSHVLGSVGAGLYPALLKQVGSTFRTYDELMVLERDTLLEYVKVQPDDVLDYDPEVDRPASEVPDKRQAEPKVPKPLRSPPRQEPLGSGAVKGLELLEQLFPQAGWERLDQWPDLYAYFQPLFQFPRGFELIARTDPLQQLLVFATILGELLSPLRKVEFTPLVGEPDFRSTLANLADRWHSFDHEIIGNLVVPRLVDLCRHVDREPGYLDSTVALKTKDEINWLRRGYFLPHLAFTQTFPVDAVVRNELPKFHQAVSELRGSLAVVARSLDDSVRAGRATGTAVQDITCPAIANPWHEISFELDSAVARRVRMALRQRVVGPDGGARVVNKFNNANLVFHTLSLCTAIDHLVQSRGSHLYQADPGIHFRSVGDDNRTPSAAVASVDSERLMRQPVDGDKARAVFADLRRAIQSDPETGLGTKQALGERLAVAIATARADSAPVSVLCLRVAEEGAAGERASATAVDATAEADGDDAEQRGALQPARPATLRAVAESLSVPAADAGAEIFRESAYVLALVVPGHDYLSLARLAQGWLARLDSAHPAVATVAGVAEYRGVANEAELLAQATAARRLAGREQARLGLSDPRSGELRVASLSDQEPVEGVEGQ